MSNALTIYNQFDEMQRAAVVLHKSGFFKDSQSEAQAIVKVMAGAELGIAPFSAMTGIHIIQGKPALGSNLIATLVKNDPRYNYRIVQCDNTAAVLVWFENGEEVGESSFTFKEAQAAGLTSKATWKSYTSDMLFARALTRGARRHAPGIFGGAPVYTPEELGADTDEDGDIVAGSYTVTSPTKPDPVDISDMTPIDETPNDLITDCRAWLESQIQNGKTNLGMVSDAAVMTELYPYADEVLEAVKGFPTWPKSYQYERGQVLKGASALAIFDWLVDTAEIEAAAAYDAMPDGVPLITAEKEGSE